MIPDDLVIRLWTGGLPLLAMGECRLLPVSQVREIPLTAGGTYDGNAGWGPNPEPPFILFDLGWKGLAGRGLEDIGMIAARVGAHLASAAEGWPGTEAHARLLPVVDFRLLYRVTPQWLAPGDDGSARAAEFAQQIADDGVPGADEALSLVTAGAR